MSTSTFSVFSSSRIANPVDWIALILAIVGGLNWGLVGAFNLDLVAMLFGAGSILSRVVYILVGLAAIYLIMFAARLGSMARRQVIR